MSERRGECSPLSSPLCTSRAMVFFCIFGSQHRAAGVAFTSPAKIITTICPRRAAGPVFSSTGNATRLVYFNVTGSDCFRIDFDIVTLNN